MVMGFIASYFLGHPLARANSKVISQLLKIAVVGLGFGMNLQETLAAGQDGIGLTACFIAFTLGIAMILSWLLKLPPKLSYLLGTGTAICGGSAIATVSPIISATEKDISVSIWGCISSQLNRIDHFPPNWTMARPEPIPVRYVGRHRHS